MLYDEFIQGTGCKANDYNYQIYKRLEILYMNDDTVTKEDIYEYGKKLVNNELTAKQLEWNADIDRRVEELNKSVEYYKGEIEYYKKAIELWKGFEEEKQYRKSLKRAHGELRYWKNQVRELKACKYV